MRRHLIVLDLDGTLLKNDKTIPTRTFHVLQQAAREGHLLAIATGRPYRASKMYYQQLGLRTPIVNSNGAYVFHPGDRSFVPHHSPLDLETAITVIETCRAFQVNNIVAEVIDDIYLEHYDEKFIETFTLNAKPAAHGSLENILPTDPTSLLVYPRADNAEELRNIISGKRSQGVDQRSWGAPYNLIEVIRAGNSKAMGLRKIVEYCNLSMKDVIAFGDENNDLEMLREAGTGVAMGNASAEAKRTADEVTLTNEEDGIALYLEERLKLKPTSTT
ncbi:Cof-type HAD-IIB family hydrolase [Bacillus piscicola]|uniref:Cof-type HAD-IIB family hydrolase n=1 Tax=Bacillus piscicola TaxID=1632684 RepID=UPI001F09F18F|nr:Cof-type HAD-IIB family hydrolase [Bacillus piscicola]